MTPSSSPLLSPSSGVYLNRIATAVPEHDVHRTFVEYALSQLDHDPRSQKIFRRLAEMGGIESRHSFIRVGHTEAGAPVADVVLAEGGAEDGQAVVDRVYAAGSFPSTAARMRLFERFAPILAERAVERLDLGADRAGITHVVVTSCTGMSAPGIDLQIAERCGLPSGVERTMVGFMGCYAAVNAMKLARHIVRSEPSAKVLMINLELCTLHLKETTNLEQILSFFLFADGCAASLITAEPSGFSLDSFHAILAPETKELITWNVGDSGFDMLLSGRVPGAIREALCGRIGEILRGATVEEIGLWAVHPGGRSVLDAVQSALELPEGALRASRDVLRRYGNMSSPSVVFVLKELMASATPGQRGCAMAFGPGLVAETMLFHAAG